MFIIIIYYDNYYLTTFIRFYKVKKNKKVIIEIENTTHKFSTNSYPSGKNIRYQPIFGSKVYIDNKLYTKSTYGLPFIRFAKHSEPEITYKNKTLFTFNIHCHFLPHNDTNSMIIQYYIDP